MINKYVEYLIYVLLRLVATVNTILSFLRTFFIIWNQSVLFVYLSSILYYDLVYLKSNI